MLRKLMLAIHLRKHGDKLGDQSISKFLFSRFLHNIHGASGLFGANRRSESVAFPSHAFATTIIINWKKVGQRFGGALISTGLRSSVFPAAF